MLNKYRFMRLLFDTEGEGTGNGEGTGEGAGNTPAGTDNSTGTSGSGTNNNGAGEGAGNGDKGEGEKKYTDADIDRIINKKFAEWQTKQDKAVSEAAKLAQMDAQQKAEYERDQLKAELEELKTANARAQMTVTARGILQEKGVSVPDSVVDHLIGKDAEDTKTAVDAFADAFNQAVTDAVKNLNKKATPRTGGHGTTTKAEIMKISDPLERQAAIRKNIKEFNHM